MRMAVGSAQVLLLVVRLYSILLKSWTYNVTAGYYSGAPKPWPAVGEPRSVWGGRARVQALREPRRDRPQGPEAARGDQDGGADAPGASASREGALQRRRGRLPGGRPHDAGSLPGPGA